MEFLQTVVIFLLVLGVMVLVHEWGHYVVAKHFGVGIEKFSIGMGPRVTGFRKGETDFVISAIPIGGYVKMEGEVPEEIRPAEELSEEEQSRAFTYKPAYQRWLIAFAGPFLNIVLACVLAPVIYLVGMEVPAYLKERPVVQGLTPFGAAAEAGFKVGDELMRIDGESYATWEEAFYPMYLSPGKPLPVVVRRGDETLTLTLTPEIEPVNGVGMPGFAFKDNWYVAGVAEGSAAAEAGLEENDRILSIDGIALPSAESVGSVLNTNAEQGQKRTLVVERDGELLTVMATPKLEGNGRFMLGITLGIRPEMVVQRYGVAASLRKGGQFLRQNVFWLGKFMNKLFSAEVSTKLLGGPVAIAKQVGIAARMGWGPLLVLCTLITLQLGILNLLPIPALDGGHILFASWEMISRRRPNQRFMEITQTAGFALLLTAIALITVQDILKEKKFFIDLIDAIK